MQQSDQINELATALSKAQALIQPASKESENLGFKNAKTGKASKYADLTAVWEACRGALSANGLSVIQLPVDADVGRVALTSMLMHSSGQYISSTFSMRLMQDTPHGAGSALTYLRRYALAALVGVVADEDDDGNAASNHQSSTSDRQPAAPVARADSPATDARLDLIARIKAIAPAAKALGFAFPDKKPADMSLADLQALYAACVQATKIDP